MAVPISIQQRSTQFLSYMHSDCTRFNSQSLDVQLILLSLCLDCLDFLSWLSLDETITIGSHFFVWKVHPRRTSSRHRQILSLRELQAVFKTIKYLAPCSRFSKFEYFLKRNFSLKTAEIPENPFVCSAPPERIEKRIALNQPTIGRGITSEDIPSEFHTLTRCSHLWVNTENDKSDSCEAIPSFCRQRESDWNLCHLFSIFHPSVDAPFLRCASSFSVFYLC